MNQAQMAALSHADWMIFKEVLTDVLLYLSLQARIAAIRDDPFGDYEFATEIKTVLARVPFHDDAKTAAAEILRLLEHRQAAPAIPALAVLAQSLEKEAGASLPKLQALRRRLGWLDVTPAITSWPFPTNHNEVAERLFGKGNLKPIYYLRRALTAADAVVRIDVKNEPKGTGFLVSPDLLITCRHVIADISDASRAVFRFFNEDQDPFPTEAPRKEIIAAFHSATPLFYTPSTPSLDFSILRIQGAPPKPHFLRLNPSPVQKDDQVVIIQHPDGSAKQIGMQNNLVARADHESIEYSTSTSGGSSGSPVFDYNFSVVAVHRGYNQLNIGTSMIAIVNHLKQHAPGIWKEIESHAS